MTHHLETLIERNGSKTCKKLIKWNCDAEKAFADTKNALCSAPVLSFPDEISTYILDTDVSYFEIGAVLSQKLEDGSETVLHYASNRLSKVEMNFLRLLNT